MTSSCFLGVFASNELPSKIPIYPSGLIANTDPNNKPGQHWVAMFLEEDKEEFFDTYGLPPNFYTPRFTKFLTSHPGYTERNVGTLQALNSDVCLVCFICFTEVATRILNLLSKVFVWTTLKPTIVVLCSLRKVFLFNARGLVTRVACPVTCPEDKLNAVFVTVIK